MGLFSNIKKRMGGSSGKAWKDIEYFDEKWEERVKRMAVYIGKDEPVMDLGCGQMKLKKYLDGNRYIPVDYIKRDPDTITCDFNKKEFPGIKAAIAFISGCLEYIKDPDWFIQQVCTHTDKAILSYCCTDEFPSAEERRRNHWMNDLSFDQVVTIFRRNGFLLHTENKDGRDRIMVFTKA